MSPKTTVEISRLTLAQQEDSLGGQEAYLVPLAPSAQSGEQTEQYYSQQWPAQAPQHQEGPLQHPQYDYYETQLVGEHAYQMSNPLPQFTMPAFHSIFRPRPQQPKRNEKRKKNRPAMEDGESDDDEQCEHTAKRLASELSRFHLNK